MTDKETNQIPDNYILTLWTEAMEGASINAKKNHIDHKKYTDWLKKVIYFQTAVMLFDTAQHASQ